MTWVSSGWEDFVHSFFLSVCRLVGYTIRLAERVGGLVA